MGDNPCEINLRGRPNGSQPMEVNHREDNPREVNSREVNLREVNPREKTLRGLPNNPT